MTHTNTSCARAQGKAFEDMDKDELDGLEDDIDEEDEKMFEMYR